MPLSSFCRQGGTVDGLAYHCRACKGSANKAWRVANPEQVKQRAEANYARNKDRVKAQAHRWQKANPDKVRAKNARRYARVKEHHATLTKRWREDNRGAARELVMRRYRAAKRATPAWADFAAIRRVYEAAVRLGFEVDHVVPLQSPIVCGLHCHGNMQLLDERENMRKSNRSWPDMP